MLECFEQHRQQLHELQLKNFKIRPKLESSFKTNFEDELEELAAAGDPDASINLDEGTMGDEIEVNPS